jgi:hypothetical protein
MKRRFFLTALAAFACVTAIAQSDTAAKTSTNDDPKPFVMERDLAAGSTVVLEMNVGDLTIKPTAGTNRIRLEIRTGREDAKEPLASSVRRFDVNGARAAIELHIPKDLYQCSSCNGGSKVTLYVPAQSLLKVKLGVGDLTVLGVRGDKELHVGIGDLRIGFDENDEYSHIETSTHIGDIGDPLHTGEASGFLGKSEDFSRQGHFHLRASVGIGDLNLFAEGKS